jgi:hypothetical protein
MMGLLLSRVLRLSCLMRIMATDHGEVLTGLRSRSHSGGECIKPLETPYRDTG